MAQADERGARTEPGGRNEAPPVLRPAAPGDLDALVALETAAFAGDRLSRRSLRRFLGAPGARLIVAETPGIAGLAGYALVLFRAGTALGRLYSLAAAPAARGRGLARALLERAERAAYAAGAIVLRLEVRADNRAAIALYESAGYRRFARLAGYYDDGMDAWRLDKRLAPPADGAPLAAVPFYEQSTDFTCGPACVAMALAWAGVEGAPDQDLELVLWREATTIFTTSGHGGCEPYGLAGTLARRGLATEIHVNRPPPYFLDGVRSEDKRAAMRATQRRFVDDARALAVPVRGQALAPPALLAALDSGRLALVLVSGYRMFAKKVPHWLLVIGHDGGHVFVHDPWVEHAHFETASAAAGLPIPLAEFQRMARYGRDGLRAAILVARNGRTA